MTSDERLSWVKTLRTSYRNTSFCLFRSEQPILNRMRLYWRLFKVIVVVIGCTIYTNLMARLKPKAKRTAYRVRRQQVGARLVCRALNYRVSMTGTPPAGCPMLYVCNHICALDPIMIGSQTPVCFAGKAELGSWPVVGWVCRTHGMLFVNRERRTSTSTFVEQVQEKLEDGVSLLVFPEGTTSWGFDVDPFKTGAFEAVAGREGAAVLPFFLDVTALDGKPTEKGNGRHALSHNHHEEFVDHALNLFSFKRADIEIRVGEPVLAENHNRKELARLTHQQVRALGGDTLAEMAIVAEQG